MLFQKKKNIDFMRMEITGGHLVNELSYIEVLKT